MVFIPVPFTKDNLPPAKKNIVFIHKRGHMVTGGLFMDYTRMITHVSDWSLDEALQIFTHWLEEKELNEFVESAKASKKQRQPALKHREIIIPWQSPDFLSLWSQWKEYKAKEHKFNYKSEQSEQAALNQLAKLSDAIEYNAIQIIHQSMANGWKGFFKLQNNATTTKQQSSGGGSIEALFGAIDSNIY